MRARANIGHLDGDAGRLSPSRGGSASRAIVGQLRAGSDGFGAGEALSEQVIPVSMRSFYLRNQVQRRSSD
jgi:hypothetical protein